MGQVFQGVAATKEPESFPALSSKVGLGWTLAPAEGFPGIQHCQNAVCVFNSCVRRGEEQEEGGQAEHLSSLRILGACSYVKWKV